MQTRYKEGLDALVLMIKTLHNQGYMFYLCGMEKSKILISMWTEHEGLVS